MREKRLLQNRRKHVALYSLILRFSRRFGRVHVLVSSLMSLVPGSYGHFKNWFENTKNQVWNSKCISSFKDGKIFLKCNFCHFESAITPNGIYWSVGTFTRHFRDSPDCYITRCRWTSVSDTLTVSLALSYTIPNIYSCQAAYIECVRRFISFDLLILCSDFRCWLFNSWMLIGTQVQRQCKFQASTHC